MSDEAMPSQGRWLKLTLKEAREHPEFKVGAKVRGYRCPGPVCSLSEKECSGSIQRVDYYSFTIDTCVQDCGSHPISDRFIELYISLTGKTWENLQEGDQIKDEKGLWHVKGIITTVIGRVGELVAISHPDCPDIFFRWDTIKSLKKNGFSIVNASGHCCECGSEKK